MTPDANVACADMILADAITDIAQRTAQTEMEIWEQLIDSGAYDALYDEQTGLWVSEPDTFIYFFEQMRRMG